MQEQDRPWHDSSLTAEVAALKAALAEVLSLLEGDGDPAARMSQALTCTKEALAHVEGWFAEAGVATADFVSQHDNVEHVIRGSVSERMVQVGDVDEIRIEVSARPALPDLDTDSSGVLIQTRDIGSLRID